MNETTAYSKKELILFFAVAFGFTFLMGVPLGICQRSGAGTDVFPIAQMLYPAAGVTLACLLARRGDGGIPRRFFVFYVLVTAVMVVFCLVPLFIPGVDLYLAANYLIMAASVAAWVVLLTERKEKRRAWGLGWKNTKASLLMILLFFLLYALRDFIAFALAGMLGDALAYWATPAPYILLAVVVLNFFLTFLMFFGEEYGWRYYLQPWLQKRLGARWGVLALGVLWGCWHLPLNLFYYSPETSLQSFVSQLAVCLTLGVFFAYAYAKTGNFWVPVILHFMNNNLIPVFTGSADVSGQVLTWGDVALTAVLLGVLHLPFLASKVFDTALSPADGAESRPAGTSEEP